MEMMIVDYLKPREPFKAGNHVARCYSVIDLGTHSGEWQGRVTVSRHVLITFEVPIFRHEEKLPDGTVLNMPKVYGKRYSISMSPKSNLRKHLESWRGGVFTADEIKGFNLFSLIGVPACIQIIHEKQDDGSIRDSLAGITSVPEGLETPRQENPDLPYAFDMAAKRWPPFPAKMPEWVKNKIRESREWKEIYGAGKTIAGADAPPAEPADPAPDATAPRAF